MGIPSRPWFKRNIDSFSSRTERLPDPTPWVQSMRFW
jgi:hypothetical protein